MYYSDTCCNFSYLTTDSILKFQLPKICSLKKTQKKTNYMYVSNMFRYYWFFDKKKLNNNISKNFSIYQYHLLYQISNKN